MKAPSALLPVIQRVILRTKNAAKLADFYQKTLGLRPESLDSRTVGLFHPKTGDILLILLESTEARPVSPHAPGLFHFAFLFAELEDWKAAVRQALKHSERFHGASDHGVSWAVYLEDPDGNGLELAWDKPAEEWPWRGDQIQMVTRALPLQCILAKDDTGRHEVGEFCIGHLHLLVGDLGIGEAYQQHLGLRVTQSSYSGALFLARNSYHHHLAINTWNTVSGMIRQKNAIGLVGWDMTHERAETKSIWQDPLGFQVTLLPGLTAPEFTPNESKETATGATTTH